MPIVKYLICVACLLSGCSQTTVHLYGRYLPAQQINKITEKLRQEQFKVVVNKLPFPDTIHSSSIIYSPFIKEPLNVELLIHSMLSIG